MRLKEAIIGIVLIVALVFAFSNPNITGLFWQNVNDLSYEKDINMTLNSSTNLTVDLESPRIPRLTSFKLTGNVNGSAEIYLKATNKTYLIVNGTENFEDKCEETCSIDEFNQTSFELIVKLNGTLELKKANYVVQNLTWVEEEKNPVIDKSLVSGVKEKSYDIIVILEDPKGKKFSVANNEEEQRKERIKIAQEEVKKILDKNETKIEHEYSNINALELKVTEKELEKIEKNKNIKSIIKDNVGSISLSKSVPLIKADVVQGIKINGINLTGKGVSVCIIDTGIAYNHSDFGGFNSFPNAKVIGGHNYCADENCSSENNNPYDDNGHGTHVAGIIAANGKLRGVAPEATLVAMKVANSSGKFHWPDVVDAIDWCINNQSKYNISVISLSLGDGEHHNNRYTQCQLGSIDLNNSDGGLVANAIDTAVAKNIFVVAASGNDGASDGINYPACAPNATSVGSSNDGSGGMAIDTLSLFSNTDRILDLLAPGYSINSTVPKGSCSNCSATGYRTLSGTSMAAPHVAGAAALIYQKEKLLNKRNATPSVVKELLKTRTNKFINDSRTGLSFPRIDVLQAVNAILQVNGTENSLKKDGYGKVKFGKSIDLTKVSEAFVIGNNSIFMNASKYSQFNKSANLTIYSLNFKKTPIVLKNGAVCHNCKSRGYDGKNFTFEVAGFSNYSAGANSELKIFDENDPEGGWMNRTTYEKIIFYANYSNRTSGAPITAASCNISFSDLSGSMNYTSSTKLFEFSRNFTTAGPYYYNVSCSQTNYEYLKTSDDISVLPGCGLPPPNVNWTIENAGIVCNNTFLYFKNQTLFVKRNTTLVLENTTFVLDQSNIDRRIIINQTSNLILKKSIIRSGVAGKYFDIYIYGSANLSGVTFNLSRPYAEANGINNIKNSVFLSNIDFRGNSINKIDKCNFSGVSYFSGDSVNTVNNSLFFNEVHFHDNSNNTIENANMKYKIYFYNNSVTYVKNSNLNSTQFGWLSGNPTVDFLEPKSIVKEVNSVRRHSTTIKGYVDFTSSLVGGFVSGSIIHRFYPVVINYTNGSMAVNRYVNVTNGTNILWQGYTNSQGIAYPNLTFVSTTYAKIFNISVNSKQNIALLTDTPIVFTLDATAPILNISLPRNNSLHNSKTITLNYTAHDDTAISQCWYANVTGNRINLPGCKNVTFSGKEGRNNITVYANDSSNQTASKQVFFIVDTTPPTWNETPTNRTVEFTHPFYYDVNATDPSGISQYWINDTTYFKINKNIGIIQNNTGLPIGTRWLNISVNDTLNNRRSTIINVTTRDTNAPVVGLELPANNTLRTVNSTTFNYNVSDANSISNCSLILNNKNNETNTTITEGITQSFARILANGQYNWSVNCTDAAGNTGASVKYNLTVDIAVSAINDSTPPALVVYLPRNNSLHNTKTLTLNYSASDNINISECWYVNVTGGELKLPGCINVTFFGQEGLNNITVYVNDTVNHINSTQVFFTVHTMPPTQGTPILNSTYGTNTSNENLTVYNQSTFDPNGLNVTNIINWYRNGASIIALNMPFESDNSAGAGKTKDYSHYGNNGTVNGATWVSNGGFDGKGAYKFNGVDDYIEINDSASLTFNTSEAFSVEVWVKTDNVGWYAAIIGKVSSSIGASSSQWGLAIAPGAYPYFAVSDGASWYNAIANISILDGKWHHLVGIWNTTDVSIYVDGSLPQIVCSPSCTPPSLNEVSASTFIGTTDTGSIPFNGTINSVRIYNRSLSAEQIKALYNNRTDRIVKQEIKVGETWQAEITPNNGYVDGLAKKSNNLTVLGVTNTPPTWVETPQNKTLEFGDSFYYDVNATDPDGISQYWINDTGYFKINKTTGVIEESTSVPIGTRWLNISVNDTLNSRLSTVINITTRDTNAPVVKLQSPANNTLRTDNSTTINYNVSDANSISNCSLILNKVKVANNLTITKGITQSFARTLANGKYNWSVNCTDAAGNTGKSGIFKLTINVFGGVVTPPGSNKTGKNSGGIAPYIGPPKSNETPALRTPAKGETTPAEKAKTEEKAPEKNVEEKPKEEKPTPNTNSGRSGLLWWIVGAVIASAIILLLLLWPKGTLIADSGTIEKLISENKIKKYRKIYTLKENCEKHSELKNLVAFELEKKYEWKVDLIHNTYKLPMELCRDITFALTHYAHRMRNKKIFTMEQVPELYSREFKKIKFVNLFEEKKV